MLLDPQYAAEILHHFSRVLEKVQKAENAVADAVFAIEHAIAAFEEADYLVLDAALARMKADEVAESNRTKVDRPSRLPVIVAHR